MEEAPRPALGDGVSDGAELAAGGAVVDACVGWEGGCEGVGAALEGVGFDVPGCGDGGIVGEGEDEI